MEQYTDSQMQAFQKFYEDCLSRKIDPLSGEADRQRAELLANGSAELTKILGAEPDASEAYRLGREYAENKAAAAARAEREAKIAEARRADESAAALEREISQTRGRDKRLFFLRKGVESADADIAAANEASRSAAMLWDSMNKLEQQRESSWGTLGGIAAGVTGSTAVGAAVAADAMSKNAQIRARNQEISDRNLKAAMPLADAASASWSAANKKKELIKAEIEKVKLHLTQEPPLAELMDSLTLSKPVCAFTDGGTMLIRTTLEPKRSHTVAGSVDAVVDGCLMAEVYEGDGRIGCAYLNLPRGGADGETELTGHCLEAKEGGKYTVVITPLALWLIEKYTPPVIKYICSSGRRMERLEYQIPDLGGLIPAYGENRAWSHLAVHGIIWQQRLEEIEREKAEAERENAERARKTRRALMIAIPAAVVVIVAGVFLSNAAQARAEEAARQDAYNAALALVQEGEYNKAVDAFTELGDYKDSAEQIKETKYVQALSLFADGNYGRAVNILTKLGDYKDSAEQIALIEEASNAEQYQLALGYIDEEEFQAAYDTFIELGDYKDSAAIAAQLLRESNAYRAAAAAYAEGDLQPTVDIMRNNKYITPSPEDIDNVNFLLSYIGKWEYLSGDARVLTMVSKDSAKHVECLTVEGSFKYGNNPYISIVDGNRFSFDMWFTVDFDNLRLEPITYYVGGDLYAELTDQGTLLITIERRDGEIITCEYERVEE